MARIRENGPYTVIIEFNVKPENQKALIQEILTWGDPSQYPGFVSASFHASRDGRRVINYAQWESEKAYEGFRAARALDDTAAILEAIHRLGASIEVRAYDVIRVVEATGT
jgi:heme-degrading monooxygenase HmoA